MEQGTADESSEAPQPGKAQCAVLVQSSPCWSACGTCLVLHSGPNSVSVAVLAVKPVVGCVLRQPVHLACCRCCCLHAEQHNTVCGGRGAACSLKQVAALFSVAVAVAGGVQEHDAALRGYAAPCGLHASSPATSPCLPLLLLSCRLTAPPCAICLPDSASAAAGALQAQEQDATCILKEPGLPF